MNSMSMFKAKSRNKRIDSVYLLANRIDIGCLAMANNGQWNTRKTSASAHIKQSSIGGQIDIRKQNK